MRKPLLNILLSCALMLSQIFPNDVQTHRNPILFEVMVLFNLPDAITSRRESESEKGSQAFTNKTLKGSSPLQSLCSVKGS